MGVVVLHADEVDPEEFEGVLRRQVVGVQVVGHDLRAHREQPLQMLDPLGERLERLEVLEVTDVMRQEAMLSHHIGDLENFETLESFTQGVEHLQRLFAVSPQVVAYDLHPDYLSTKYALELLGVDLVGVQHHHAHIASCLADNDLDGPVIGVAFDGTGYGTDGTIWGGEFLIATLAKFLRAGHLTPVPMPGGAAAV